MRKTVVARATVLQRVWRDGASAHFNQPDGVYHAPTAPLVKPTGVEGVPCEGYSHGFRYEWSLHSVVPFPTVGEPKLLVIWELVEEPAEAGG